MKQFQNKKKIRSKIYSRTVVILLSIVLLILIKAVFNISSKQLESRQARDQSRIKLAELEERQNKLQSETNALKTNMGLEEEIRSKFSVAKPGEEVIVIVPKEEEVVLPKPSWFESFWTKIKSWFD